MKDDLDNMIADIRAFIVETCAKVAEMQHRHHATSGYDNAYNQAVAEIAAKIRSLNTRD